MIVQGMKIKIFPDTNVQAYKDMIYDEGYFCSLEDEYLVVGRPFKNMSQKTWFSYSFNEWRVRAGLSKKEAAKMFGVLKPTIDRWESGATLPSSELRPTITEITGIEFGTMGEST